MRNVHRTPYLLALLAAILYNSWPLGYVLNPQVAHHSLASGLEAIHQPYNWLFVGADVVSGICILAVCSILFRAYTYTSTVIVVTLACTGIFALGTIADALLPERCVPNLMACPSFTQDHTLLLHGIVSILASIFLFVALFVAWLQERRNLLFTTLLLGYAVFGAISLVQAITPHQSGNWSQDYYMILCGIWLACLPYACATIAKAQPKLSP